MSNNNTFEMLSFECKYLCIEHMLMNMFQWAMEIDKEEKELDNTAYELEKQLETRREQIEFFQTEPRMPLSDKNNKLQGLFALQALDLLALIEVRENEKNICENKMNNREGLEVGKIFLKDFQSAQDIILDYQSKFNGSDVRKQDIEEVRAKALDLCRAVIKVADNLLTKAECRFKNIIDYADKDIKALKKEFDECRDKIDLLRE